MATSGTTAFNLDLSDIVEEAASRAGVEVRSGFGWQGAIRSLNLLFQDLANRQLNLFTILQKTLAVTEGTAQYTLASDTIDAVNFMLRSSTTDFYLERLGVGSYASISNKTQTGRPTMIWVERLTSSVRVNLWPVPDAAYTLVYYQLRKIEDAVSASENPDVPTRCLPTLISGLAYFLALKRSPPDLNLVQFLKSNYIEDLAQFQIEDRGRESFYIGIYSR